ncbi:MAG: 30S ribosomal protein S20 [Magnetococcales bacterium]|nr:30S ribosomal protein S20 [Magnetococcales bacterium]
MANIKSAMKRNRQTIKRTNRNKDARSRMRTFQKKAADAIEAGDHGQAMEALREVNSVLATSVRKGVIHRNQAARHMKRLNLKVKGLAAAGASA